MRDAQVTERERCFECNGRQWVATYGDADITTWPCPRCNGSGYDPESDRYRTEAQVVSE